MPYSIGGTQGVYLVSDTGVKREFGVRVVPAHGDNLIEVVVYDDAGEELGTPVRFHMNSSGFIAMDRTGVSNAVFIVDSENCITTG
jgi:hypothetical protein